MSKVVVTGASGFIGSYLVKGLAASGLAAISLDSSHGDISSLDYFSRRELEGVSHVFHLAGQTFVPDSWENPHKFYRVNTLGVETVLEFCRRSSASLTYVSAYIYGFPQSLPVLESDPIALSNPYAHSKYLGEELCRFYASVFDLGVTIIRPFNVYGPGQEETFLIPSIIKQVLCCDQVKVKDLNPKRDYVYVEDLVEAIIKTLEVAKKGLVINIGSGVSYSVREVIDIAQQYAGTRKSIICDGEIRFNEIPDVRADTSIAKKHLGWQCKVSFESGIDQMIRWKRSHV